MTVPSLFDPPAQHHSETSKEAAEAIKPHVQTLRSRVLEVLMVNDLTDQEIAQHFGMAENTTRPRRIELVRDGLVVEAGKRKTRSGRRAIVWRAKFRRCPICNSLSQRVFCSPEHETEWQARR